MTGLRATKFTELHDILSTFRGNKAWIFRGHSNPDWPLVPKAGRHPYSISNDISVFKSWKRRAIEYLKFRPESDWEWLAIAQHHGLATRLLDWTSNPLAAAYFAVREMGETDAVIYASTTTRDVTPGGDLGFDSPFDIDFNGAVFRPTGITPRIVRQGGLFTVHGNPEVSLEDNPGLLYQLAKIVIDKSYRGQLLVELSYYGVNAATLFPDLDGLSQYVNWVVESGEYYVKQEKPYTPNVGFC